MTGFEVLERLNMLTDVVRPKVLVMSARREIDDIQRASHWVPMATSPSPSSRRT